MEFEFIKNHFTGEYLVRCEMGHEVIARLLQEEIGKDERTMMAIISLLEQAKVHSSREMTWQGKEISFSILESEVVVYENTLGFDMLNDNSEDFSVYESESKGECGLEDFYSVAQQWRRFVSNR
ncbi:YacL family protein [Vibrio hippocampi]|uniref:Uncharacterized protein n=1 Tax=Vibrio hippocampi TaxID=654686 RepID=A0ABN8DJD1_9VIBR|nr:YacL family protein [Vibrio hippocampi]CAH0526911.1 hypothetical protein VHP8226_02282 [Vibrio hippocampi]